MGAWSDRNGKSMERSIGEQYERDQSKTVEVLFLCRKLSNTLLSIKEQFHLENIKNLITKNSEENHFSPLLFEE